MSDGLRWAPIGWPPRGSPRPTFPAERTLLLRFLHSYLHCLQIDAGWAPRGQIGELIFAPRVSRECTSGCIEVRERGTDCCAPYLGGSFCGMHPQHVCVCVLVIVCDGHCSVCAATGMETALSETHESGGLSSTHENIFHPPCFIFNQTFVALTVRFQSDLSSLVPCGSNVQLGSG